MRGCRALLPVLILLAAPLWGQTVLEDSISMRDGVPLDATITIPAGTVPAGGFPGVVLVHGYGGEKGDMQILSSILSNYGYASVAYSVRGQGNSGGTSTTGGEIERLDLNEVIQYFRAYPGINPDRIGVAGASQGGIHAWMAAVFRMEGVRAVAPAFATPHFALDLIAGNCINQALAWELSLSSVRYAPERDAVRDLIIRDDYEGLKSYVNTRDLEVMLDSVLVPVFQALAWKDALFPVNAGIRAAGNLHARDIPIWSYYGTGGHSEPSDLNELTFVIMRSLEWFDRWLKGNPLDQDDVPLVFYTDDRPGWPHHVTAVWPPEPSSVVRLHVTGDGLLPALPVGSESFPFALEYDPAYTPLEAWNDTYGGSAFRAAFSSAPARFLSPALLDTVDVTGVPRAHLVTASDAGQFQAHALLFDVSQTDTGLVWRLMSRGTNGIRGQEPQAEVSTDVDCNALSHRIPAGHMIGMEITSLDVDESGDARIIPYFMSTHSWLTTSPAHASYVDIPVVGSLAFTGVAGPAAHLPENFTLYQNYPNPFNPSTTIGYGLPVRSHVTLTLFNTLGQKVATLVDGSQEAGYHKTVFDASALASGVYLYRLQVRSSDSCSPEDSKGAAGEYAQTRKLMVLR